MPPYGAWAMTWLSMTSLSTSPFERTTAAAVSSHEVSMPSTVMTRSEATAGRVRVASHVEQGKSWPFVGGVADRGELVGLEQPQLDVVVAQQRDDAEHRALTGRVGPGEEVFVVTFAEGHGGERVVIDLGDGAHRRVVEQRQHVLRAQAGQFVVAGQVSGHADLVVG